MPRRRPSPTLLALAVLDAIAGGTFTLQGLGVPIGHSFMVNDLRWTAIGLVMLVLAAVVFVRQRRGRA